MLLNWIFTTKPRTDHLGTSFSICARSLHALQNGRGAGRREERLKALLQQSRALDMILPTLTKLTRVQVSLSMERAQTDYGYAFDLTFQLLTHTSTLHMCSFRRLLQCFANPHLWVVSCPWPPGKRFVMLIETIVLRLPFVLLQKGSAAMPAALVQSAITPAVHQAQRNMRNGMVRTRACPRMQHGLYCAEAAPA
jgi:hypothetical protein